MRILSLLTNCIFDAGYRVRSFVMDRFIYCSFRLYGYEIDFDSIRKRTYRKDDDVVGKLDMDSCGDDADFRSDSVTMDALTKEVKYLAVSRRLTDLSEVMLTSYQCFRTGIEGTISCLKRVYRLSRCCYHGFKGFCKAVGSAIFCHNPVIMGRKTENRKNKIISKKQFLNKNYT
jgi:hypothetical protein